MIYTSGSTGRPKGVAITHRGVCNLLDVQSREFGLASDDRVLQFASIGFDASVYEIFGALGAGACVELAPAPRLLAGQALVDLLRERGITVALLPPTVLRTLPAAKLPALRVLASGGEECSPEIVARWAFGRRFLNLYGPTENSVVATWAECDPGAARVPIGRPLPNVEAHVLDEELRPVEPGAVGELFLGGAGLARGYLGAPALTADRFVPDVSADGRRVYKTGDRVRLSPDGQLEYLGRTDDQVKIRGIRIEIGEVAAALREHSAIVDAFASVDDGDARRRLIAYVVVAGAPPTARELRRFLAHRLPDAMLPAAFLAVPELPLTTSGKVDRERLAALSPELRLPFATVHDAPRTPAERVMADVWAEVLDFEGVGVNDNFFELGGDSILSIRVVACARDKGLVLTPQDVFDHPVLVDLAAAARPISPTNRRAGAGDRPARSDATAPTDQYPLSPMQLGMLFHTLAEPERGAYVDQTLFRFRGRVDEEALVRAWRALLHRHPALRSRFEWEDLDEPQQVVEASVDVPVTMLDWRRLAPAARVERLRELVTTERERGLDLRKAPVMRLTLIRLEDEASALVWTTHHMLLDGWSLGLLQRELAQLYSGEDPGPPPALAYGDYVRWLRARDGDDARGFWRSALAGFRRATPLPSGGGDGGAAAGDVGYVTVTLAEPMTASLARVARELRVTVNTLVQGAWALLLAAVTGEDDVIFGVTVTGRPAELAGAESTIGLFINTLPARIRLEKAAKAREWLTRIQDDQSAARRHEHFPLWEVKRVSSIPSDAPLFETLLVFESAPSEPAPFRGLQSVEVEGVGRTNYPLSILVRRGERLEATFGYDRRRLSRVDVERFAAHWRRLLEQIAANPDARVAVLAANAELAAEPPVDAVGPQRPVVGVSMHGLVEGQVDRRPAALAVRDGVDGGLSFAGLEERANRLAWVLRAGVGPESVVGVCAGRSMGLVVALLGVLKAGAAYLPLDPVVPLERLRWMVRDARVRVVVCEEAVPGGVWLRRAAGGGQPYWRGALSA